MFFGVCALLAKVKQKRGAKGELWKYRDVCRNGRRYVGRYGQERPNLGSNQHENARTHSYRGKEHDALRIPFSRPFSLAGASIDRGLS